MAILQIIYLIINLIGFAFGLVWFICPPEYTFISDFFTLVAKYLGNFGLIIISILAITLFLPTLAIMTAIITFTMLIGTYLK